MENKNQTYSGKSIAEQLLQNTWVGKLLYGKPKTYTDGYGVKRKDAPFKESANGQEIQRMKKTAKDAGNLIATGLAFGNPLTASKALAPLITAAQAYWIGHGIKDGAQRIENIGKETQNFVENPSWQNAGTIVKEVPMLALDVAGALPVAKTVIETGKNAVPAAQQAAQRIAGSVDDAITNATKQAVESGVVGVNELPTQLATRVTSTPKVQEPILNVGWAPSQTMSVRRAGELTEMYYPNRWDAVEEGANPFGVWLQGKFGIPRTNITNPGKGEKAVKARELFANRPQYNGKVTFKKPIQTIGEVPNRSTLSYEAERMGADGIIYNGVYDNGYNNNQVIFSFNKPELGKGYSLFERPSKLTEAERLGIPKGERNQPLNGHLKGDVAIQMFKEYGDITIPSNSKIYSQIQQLVPEARERYNLVGRTDITDDEIARSLYKRAMELNGNGNAAIWAETGEPRLLFRGDTRRYNRLLNKPEPEHLRSGTEDNSLGNLFLGELPGGSDLGIERYLHRVESHPFFGGDALWLSSTGSGIKHGKTVLQEVPTDLTRAYGQIYGPKASRSFGRVKLLPADLSAGGGNDINPFIIRAKNIRDASDEISVGADIALLKSKGIDYSLGTRNAMLKHYRTVLDDAVSKNQGLLISNPNSPFRPDEHAFNMYYALPNFNRQNAKHLFGWDLRRPVQWDVDNIYLEKGGKL